MVVFRLYCIGILILLVAVIANGIAVKLQCKTWYDLIQGITSEKYFLNTLTLKDLIWLFLAYPILLGVGGVLGQIIYQKLIGL